MPDVEQLSYTELRESITHLSHTMNDLLAVFKTAAEDLERESHPPVEANSKLAEKLDKLIEQNREIADGITMILELHKEHLPRISRQAAISAPPPRTFSRRPSKPTPTRFPQPSPQTMHPLPIQQLPPRPQPAPQQPLPPLTMPNPQPSEPVPPASQANLEFQLPNLPEENDIEPLPDFGLPTQVKPPSTPPPPKKKRRFL